MTIALNFPTPIAIECAKLLRHELNRHDPCILRAVVFGPGYMPPRIFLVPSLTEGICLDLSQDGRPITPANLGAALGSRHVSAAVAMLIDIAAGQPLRNAASFCSQISSVVFSQIEKYPLDRPDVRRPDEGGPS